MRGGAVDLSLHRYELFQAGDSIPVSTSPSFPEGIAECEEGKFFLGIQATHSTPQGDRVVYLGSDMTLRDFVELCEQLPDEEIYVMSAATAIKKHAISTSRR